VIGDLQFSDLALAAFPPFALFSSHHWSLVTVFLLCDLGGGRIDSSSHPALSITEAGEYGQRG
jgi:hypothetical protein